MRSLFAAAAALFPLALALVLPAAAARADGLPAGARGVKVTFELTGIPEHPDYLFVVYPYMDCQIGKQHFELNPHLDRAWNNYQVLRPEERYEEPKYCTNGRIYAFEAKAFTTEERVLDDDQGFYRKKGAKLLIIKEFDGLKNSEKREFVRNDPRVRRSDMFIDFPSVVPDRLPFNATHDVLRVAEVNSSRLKIEGVKVILSTRGAPDQEEPYQGTRRPVESFEHDPPWIYDPHADSLEDALEDEVWASRRPYLAGAAVAAVLLIASTGTLVRYRRRRQPKP